jgi:hypothetical protein
MTATPNSPSSSPLPSATGLNQHGANVGPSWSPVDRTLSAISFDIAGAVSGLEKNAIENGGPVSKTDLAKLDAGHTAYLADLKKVASANGEGLEKQFEAAENLLLHSYRARLYAVLRALHKRGATITLDELHARASELSVWKPLHEAVVVRWVAKEGKKPGYRPIVVSGVMRTAQALMLRDALSMIGIDGAIDCTKKGGGGEKALIMAICKDIENEYNWWWNPDIKDCFGSISPRHFAWLPIDRRLIRNVAYLPKCAKVVIPNHKDAEAILQYLYGKYPDLSEDGILSLQALTVRIVRRGLLQGSVLSPLLARAVITRELTAALSGKEPKRYQYVDDLSIGAREKGECAAAKQAVTDHLSSLPAGPIELHDVSIKSAMTQRIVVLGYSLEAGKGYGDNYVHVKPWIKRTEKFKRKLRVRLEAALPEADLFEVAESYRRQWAGAQSAWTKVPELSEVVSQAITGTYVTDFLDGIPMGVWKLNKPKLEKLTFVSN